MVALGAVCQVLSGVGFALVVSPLVMLALGHEAGLRTVLILSAVLNLSVIARMPGQVRRPDVVRLLVPAALVIPPMLLLSDLLRGTALNLVAGLSILAATAVSIAGRPLPFFERPGGAVVAGGVSGALNVLAGASGPPVALFAMSRGWPPAQMSATLQAFGLPLNVLTLIAVGLPSGSEWAEMGGAGLGLVVGMALSLPFVHRVSPVLVRRVTLGIAVLGGLTLLGAAWP
ncbi:membrane protein [Kineosporia sp. NBRC 101677]|uniref:TSUP family transporter n=1 Tax=Kineosporia sp. NBRC 101677 TaxID=3032197 RepID=UPI0024A1E218|nr:TSUP family transporter [Kineosporia sp. NBRC 101677]GLY17432.1 membrane protein [Kineosporia sp. NBRC 101677]